jgi:hypothetical protein
MNVEAISVTPTLNFQSLIIVPESLPFGEKDPSCSSLPRVKQRAQNWYLLYLRAHPRSMLNNASHAQGERAVDRIVAHAIVSNVSTFRLFFPSVCQTKRQCHANENDGAVCKNCSSNLELEGLGLLPGEVGVGEVTVLGSLAVDGVDEVELLDDDTGAHVEVGVDDLNKLLGALVGGTVGLNEDGERLGNTNGVGELDESTASELGVDERLGDPTGEVGSGTVDLAVVLSGESTTTVGTPATVGVNNDLAASKTGVTLGTTNDEVARGLNL